MRKGQLAGGKWKWWNFRERTIILRKQDGHKRAKKVPDQADKAATPDTARPDKKRASGSSEKRAPEIAEFEGWPKGISRRLKNGYFVWAIQNKKDGHCLYEVRIVVSPAGVLATGTSEQEKYGKGSNQNLIATKTIEEFTSEWGIK